MSRDKSIQESYRNLLQQTHCLVNLSDICVNKCNYGYKPTLYHVISRYKKVISIYCNKHIVYLTYLVSVQKNVIMGIN